jgi:phage-related protein
MLTIDVTADSSAAVSGLSKAETAVKNYGDAADTATRQSRDISGAIDSTGGAAGQATAGLNDLGGALATMDGPIGNLGSSMQAASVAFEALDGAATLYGVAQQGLTVVVGIFDGVMKALRLTILSNPIFIIAAIIIGIGVAFVLAYQHCETFRNIVDAAVRFVWDIIKKVFNWVSDNWPLLLTILTGPFGAAVWAITANWDTISNAIHAVFDWIKNTWDDITDFLTKPFDKAWEIIKGIIDKITGAVKGAIDLVKKIPGVSAIGGFIGSINPFAMAATPATFAAPGVARAPAATAASAAPVVNITVQTTGLGASSPQIQRAVVNALRGWSSRNGPLDVPIRTGV